MKKVVLNLVIVAFAAAVFMSCGGGSYKIKMTTESGGDFPFSLAGSGIATVDWGDGSEKNTLTLNEDGVLFEHNYKIAKVHSIIVKGDNIISLDCSDNQLTSLDVSKNTALKELHCSYNQLINLDLRKNIKLESLYCDDNQLTSLDVSKNTALKELHCSYNQLINLDLRKNSFLIYLDCKNNQFTTASLNALFDSLHSNNIKNYIKTLSVTYNPGEDDCNYSIAERRGWKFRL